MPLESTAGRRAEHGRSPAAGADVSGRTHERPGAAGSRALGGALGGAQQGLYVKASGEMYTPWSPSMDENEAEVVL